MRQWWPKFEVHYQDADTVVWLGDLVGVQRPYLISVTYGTPRDPERRRLEDELLRASRALDLNVLEVALAQVEALKKLGK